MNTGSAFDISPSELIDRFRVVHIAVDNSSAIFSTVCLSKGHVFPVHEVSTGWSCHETRAICQNVPFSILYSAQASFSSKPISYPYVAHMIEEEILTKFITRGSQLVLWIAEKVRMKNITRLIQNPRCDPKYPRLCLIFQMEYLNCFIGYFLSWLLFFHFLEQCNNLWSGSARF